MKHCRGTLFKYLGGNSGSNDFEALPSSVAPATIIGMARVVVQSATVNKKLRMPRPYIDIQLQGGTVAHTNIPEEKTHSPNWFSESLFILIYSLQENLEFVVANYHRGLRNGVIGRATFSLSVLASDPIRTGEERPILKNTTEVNGTLLFDIFYYPILHSDVRKEFKSTITGVVNLHIHQAKEIKRENIHSRKLVATVSLGWTGPPIHKTPPAELTDSLLVWNSSFDFLCFDKNSTTVVIKIVDRDDDKGAAGHISVALTDLLVSEEEKVEWWSLSGCPNGQLRLSAVWNPINY